MYAFNPSTLRVRGQPGLQSEFQDIQSYRELCLEKSKQNKQKGSCGGPKRTLDSLELEFQVVVSYHVGAGNQTQIFYKKSSKCSFVLFCFCFFEAGLLCSPGCLGTFSVD